MSQTTLDNYIHIWPQSASYIIESSSSFSSHFTFLSSHHSQLSPHFTFSLISFINLSILLLRFKIAPLTCFFFVVVLRMDYAYMYWNKIFNTTHISKRNHSCHVKCQHAMCTHESQSTVGQK